MKYAVIALLSGLMIIQSNAFARAFVEDISGVPGPVISVNTMKCAPSEPLFPTDLAINSTKRLVLKNKVIAHRGAWKNTGAPQNSYASLKAAIDLKCGGSETDVHMTADSVLVINHDPHYHGIPVQQSKWADLEKIKLPNGETLPQLSEFLKLIKTQKQTKLILELKSSARGPEWAKATVRKVVESVKKQRAQDMVVYIAFDYEICKELLRLQPGATVQYLNGDIAPAVLAQDKVCGADYHYSVYQKHPEWISEARENHIDLNAWTVDNADHMNWLLANDFDYVTTDEPELLFTLIEKSPVAAGWRLQWSDEFNKPGLPDSTKWNYNTGGHGWGNQEAQYYTQADTANAIVKNGILSIITRREKQENNEYTSARLVTSGKAEWTYGRMEIRAKLPKGVGLWPAIWMLGSDTKAVGWPRAGEIDIMEHVGYKPDSIFGTVHTDAFNHIKGTQKGRDIAIEKPYDRFNIFAIEWTPEKIDFFLNDTIYNSFKNLHKSNREWPFNKPFYLILNTAVGGGLGGKKGIDEQAFPAFFEIDYVRVFQKKNY